MTENKDKHAASSGDSTEIASSHNNNAQGQSTTAGGDGNNIKPKDKKNDSETTVALADTQHEGEKDKAPHDRCAHKDEFGTQRVYKKTSPNCVLTLYLPSREVTLSDNNPAILRGIIYVDPKAIQGYRVYAQLTLTFRYGREDEEVMDLRFYNEAIMSLHQVWPRNEEQARESLSPLQVFAIQHIDVCMFNNGKFKNIVTDSDTSSPVDHIVTSSSTLNNTITLKPQRGQTKNWIALEDTLQHNTEAVEITDIIAASASPSAAP